MINLAKIQFILLIIVLLVLGGLSIKINNIGTQIINIEKEVGSINSSLYLESENHFVEIMKKIDESVVVVVGFPASDNQDEKAVIYIDAAGNKGNLGAGFAVGDGEYILTAGHVVNGADNGGIILSNGTYISAKFVDVYPALDIAILYIGKKLIPSIEPEPQNIDIGSSVAFIGFPLGYDKRIVSQGIISSRAQTVYDEKWPTQTPIYIINSAVNRGNSGGPVFSLKSGKVVGIINQVIEGTQGLGISTEINEGMVKYMISKLKERMK
ncbi:MAG: serine protease [Candidatus Thorarchaeota archaeon]